MALIDAFRPSNRPRFGGLASSNFRRYGNRPRFGQSRPSFGSTTPKARPRTQSFQGQGGGGSPQPPRVGGFTQETNPFNQNNLLARIRSNLARRLEAFGAAPPYQYGGYGFGPQIPGQTVNIPNFGDPRTSGVPGYVPNPAQPFGAGQFGAGPGAGQQPTTPGGRPLFPGTQLNRQVPQGPTASLNDLPVYYGPYAEIPIQGPPEPPVQPGYAAPAGIPPYYGGFGGGTYTPTRYNPASARPTFGQAQPRNQGGFGSPRPIYQARPRQAVVPRWARDLAVWTI